MCRRLHESLTALAWIAGIHVVTPTHGAAVAAPVRTPPLPVVFEENCGQSEPDVRFLARSAHFTLIFSGSGPALVLPDSTAEPGPRQRFPIRFVGASADLRPEGEEILPGRTSYFSGSDPRRWISGAAHYGAVRYREVYPGIDLRFYVNGAGEMEHDWIVAPGAEPSQIHIEFPQATGMRLNKRGDLEVDARGGVVVVRRPRVFRVHGKQSIPVESRFRRRALREASIELGDYPRPAQLVIDPVLSYSSYFGGDDNSTVAYGIATDSVGNIVIAGFTDTTTLPIANPLFSSLAGGTDAFVAKLDRTGQILLSSTYIGGTAVDIAYSMAIDSQDNILVTGLTSSDDFPVKDAFQPTRSTWSFDDAYVLKLDSSGSALIFSTYLGGSNSDRAYGVAIGPGDNIAVTGSTLSTDFPTMLPLQSNRNALATDIFLSELSPAGLLQFSTYIGGSGRDVSAGIAIDVNNNIYVTGTTESVDFPILNALQSQHGNDGGSADAFLFKVASSRIALSYSTYLGGNDSDQAWAVAVDPAGNSYVHGNTSSTDFPLRNALRSTLGGSDDAFVSKLNASGAELVYSTYLGGKYADGVSSSARGIAADSLGNVYVAGSTASPDFPVVNAFQPTLLGANVYVAELTADGSSLVFSTFLGGSVSESAYSLTLGPFGDVYVTGSTLSPDFPTVDPFIASFPGQWASFIAKLGCEPDTLPGDQGNVLFAVRQATDVALQFPSAAANSWRLFRDTAKTQLGGTALVPDIAVKSFVDANAVANAPALSYYRLKGLSPCSRSTGP